MSLEYWSTSDTVFAVSMSVFGAIAVGLIAITISAAIAESKRPEFSLKKDDWKCSDSITRTHLQSVTTGKVTTLIPVTETICIEYRRVGAQ